MAKSPVSDLILKAVATQRSWEKLAPACPIQGESLLGGRWVRWGGGRSLPHPRVAKSGDLINLDLKAPQLQRNAVSCRDCVHVQESPKNGLIFTRLASVPGTRRPMLSGKDQLGLLVLLCSLYFPPGTCCMLSVRTRKRAGWERHNWMPLCTQVPFQVLALDLLCSHGARHR